MKGSRWREHSRKVIAEIIAEVGRDDPKALRKAISKAYPFGERSMWPYKVWLSEIKKQLNPSHNQRREKDIKDPNQTELF